MAFLDQPAPIAFAHRGFAPDGAENSMRAFQDAVALGYRYLETDVRVTADGVAVAFHDSVLDRVTDQRGRIADLTWRQIRTARIAGREPIPLLVDVLASWPDARVNLDVKAASSIAPAIDAIRRTASVERVCVAAFSGARIAAVRRSLGPRVCTALGPRDALRLRAPLLRRGTVRGRCAQVPYAVGPVRLVTAEYLAAAHAQGLPVHAWTVNARDDMVRLLDLGVDGVMTDRADVLRDVLRARGQWPGAPAPDTARTPRRSAETTRHTDPVLTAGSRTPRRLEALTRWHAHSRVVAWWRRARTARPETFTEKVRYKMARDRRPLLTTFADKAAVRDYIARFVGAEYLPAAYALVDDASALRDLDLPACYVVKPTHGSGAVVAVSPGAPGGARLPAPNDEWACVQLRPDEVDRDALVALAGGWLARRYGGGPNHEWAYTGVVPRVLIEEHLGGADGRIPDDYKLFVFHQRCRYVQVDTGRFGRHTQQFFTPDWIPLAMSGGLPFSDTPLPRPDRLPEMVELAERLASETDFVRVDLFVLPDRIVVGELTSYPAAGRSPFYPGAWNREFGRHWTPPRHYR